MAFILSDIISEIYDAYEALPGGRDPIVRGDDGAPLLGNLEWHKNADHPRVVWMLGGGNFDPSKQVQVGGENGAMTAAMCQFLVRIWQKDLETCWNVMVDLLAAMRATVYGPNLGAQTFTVPTETEGRHDHSGELLVLNVTLAVPIPMVGTVPLQTVTLESHESTINTGDVDAVLDGTFVAIETVVVTGPPED